ncbi:hypothetical protein Gogos_003743 [Gossypium gossypioides]|uniref:Zinc knuckle CX2CX4HX4C domain-containing protein n=1 Tax=Gossypium gossypioides TaxID=34282 RepID=A0A7J9CNT2_GOSGO|nr:hypothetical protein [Gossypium gossypioides]
MGDFWAVLDSEALVTRFLDDTVIGQAIGSIVRIDENNDSAKRGRFARMRVKYESLPNVCFKCRLYGHRIDLCPKEQPFGPIVDGMIVEHRKQQKGRSMGDKSSENQGGVGEGSKFDALGENQGLV